MDNTMKENYEVNAEVSDSEEATQEIKIEKTSAGMSKVFKAVCVGGAAAIIGIVALRKHNKKKAKAQEAIEEDYDFDVYDLDQEDLETEDQEAPEEVEKAEKK